MIPLLARAVTAYAVKKGMEQAGKAKASDGGFGGSYDPTEGTLTVYFPDGSAYEYSGVSPVEGLAFTLTPSGTRFNASIRNRYPASRT